MRRPAFSLSTRIPGARFVADTAREFLDDGCPSLAAALAYYTVFSLPPFLVLSMLILSATMDPSDVRGALEQQIEELLGPSGGELSRHLLAQAQPPVGGGWMASLLGLGALILGATGVFTQLQSSLNRVWNVRPDPAKGGFRVFLGKRAVSLLLLLVVAFLLLVSLAMSAALSAVGSHARDLLPGGLSEAMLHLLDLGLSLSVMTIVFAAMLKFLPDAEIAWRDVWIGAFVTTILFLIGKFAIGLHLGRFDFGEVYGAAAFLAVLLVWVHYVSMAVLLGAEVTHVWAGRLGRSVPPEPGAIRVVRVEKRVEKPHGDRP
ncbi:MAG: YihY/virulence factor BrkB family protein [Myxococcota bacterium]